MVCDSELFFKYFKIVEHPSPELVQTHSFDMSQPLEENSLCAHKRCYI